MYLCKQFSRFISFGKGFLIFEVNTQAKKNGIIKIKDGVKKKKI